MKIRRIFGAQSLEPQKIRKKERIFLAALLLMALILGIFGGYGIYTFQTLKDIEALNDYSLYEVPTVLYDVKGRKITEFYLYKRQLISFREIPEPLIQTLLVAEDRNFFDHGGMSFFGIVRAFFKNLSSGRVRQGGSTITQQLAKLLFTDQERTISRKVKELWITFQIEKKFTKQEILEKYLNKVYYGNNQYGVEAASKFYLGKEARALNYAEAAFLVAIPPAPSYLNPLKYPMRTKERQKFILTKLVQEKLLTPKQAEKQFNLFWINFQERLISGAFYENQFNNKDHAPYFSEYIRRLLFDKFSEKIYTGGYRVYTTIDIDKQKAAEKALRRKLADQEEFYKKNTEQVYNFVQGEISLSNTGHPRILEFLGYAFGIPEMSFYKSELEREIYQDLIESEVLTWLPAFSSFNMNPESIMLERKLAQKPKEMDIDYHPEGALVALEVPSGRILSMIGGSGYTPFNQLNRAYQSRRQPGSAFKPFIYLTALLSNRYSAASIINDIPLAYKIEDGEIWTPGNANRNYQGPIRLREGLRKSVNIVSVRLIEALGILPVVKNAMKILSLREDRFRKDYSLSLGTSELTPLELTKGYAVLANMGKDVIPHGIIRIEDRYGRIISNPEKEIMAKEPEQLIAPEYVYILIDMMKDVLRRGTAAQATAEARFFYPAAGKTGTSSNLRDAWFSGFTPHLVATVWVGFDKGITLGPGQYGGIVAAPIWMEYMKFALKDYPVSHFPYPGGLVRIPIHPANGLRMSKKCLEDMGFDPENLKEKTEEAAIQGEEIAEVLKEKKKELLWEYFIPGTEPQEESDICSEGKEITEKELGKIKLFE